MGIRISLGFVLISLISHSQDLSGVSTYTYLGYQPNMGDVYMKDVSSLEDGYKELENLYYANDLIFDTVGRSADEYVLFFDVLYTTKHFAYYAILIKGFDGKYVIYLNCNRKKSDLYYMVLFHKFDNKKLIHFDSKKQTLEIHNGTFH